MERKKIRGNIILLVTAIIWGSAFVAQSAGMNYIDPFTYNGIRTLIGGIVLIPFVCFFDKKKKTVSSSEKEAINKQSLIGGIVCGILLCVASSFQQFGISMTTAGKAGFITALYIIIVPIIGKFFGKKTSKIVWLCVLLAMAGFWLLCVKEGFVVGTGDILVLCCALVFSFHILAVDHFNDKGVDGVRMSCIQFLTAGIIMIFCMFIFEKPVLNDILEAKWTILYAGVLSCGVAYTLQIIGQRDTDPTIATLIMSLESVFAAISGWLFLGEAMSLKEILGCALVFVAVILAQIPIGLKKSEV